MLTLSDVSAVMASAAAQTYVANRPALFDEIRAGAARGEKLNADEFGFLIGSVFVPGKPGVPAVVANPTAVPPVVGVPAVPAVPAVPRTVVVASTPFVG